MTSNRPSRHHGFRYASADHDRLKRALLQPVQPWEKKWMYPSNGKNVMVYKWVRSDRKITFDDDDDGEEDMSRQDTPTPTASILPPTEASTPQPSEPEPDQTPKSQAGGGQQHLRPPSLIATAVKHSPLIRESSVTSGVSTPPASEQFASNNNATPLELGGTSDLNTPDPEIGESEDEEEPEDLHEQDQIIIGESGDLSTFSQIRRSSQEMMRRNSQEIMRRSSQEIMRRNSQEMMRRNSQEIMRRNSQEAMRRNSQEAMRRNSQELMRYATTDNTTQEIARRREEDDDEEEDHDEEEDDEDEEDGDEEDDDDDDEDEDEDDEDEDADEEGEDDDVLEEEMIGMIDQGDDNGEGSSRFGVYPTAYTEQPNDDTFEQLQEFSEQLKQFVGSYGDGVDGQNHTEYNDQQNDYGNQRNEYGEQNDEYGENQDSSYHQPTTYRGQEASNLLDQQLDLEEGEIEEGYDDLEEL